MRSTCWRAAAMSAVDQRILRVAVDAQMRLRLGKRHRLRRRRIGQDRFHGGIR